MSSGWSCHGPPTSESLGASGRSAEKLSLLTLQSKMKCDPEGYISELVLLYRHFDSSLHLFQQQAALNFSSISGVGGDPSVAKELGDMAMFLAHVTPFYPIELSDFPEKLANLLRSSAQSLPSSLRCHLTQALILLINRKFVDIGDTLSLFMELQSLGDRNLRKLAFSHVIHSIRRMNQKHKNDAKNRALQNILFAVLQEDDETRAKRSLVVLCDLHRRRVWFDDRTANAISTACFHSSSKIMISTLSFLLGFERMEEGDGSDASDSEDDNTPSKANFALSKEAVYKATHKGTCSSKKKKQAKLQRAIRSMKRQQRTSSEKNTTNYYSPLNHIIDPQGFVEKLFSRLQNCNERFEVKMMIMKVIARTIGLHRLILLNFYPFLQKYVQPHQRDITELLAAAVQACHDMVPPDAVEPLFRQVVNQFVHDRSRTEAIAVGLNVVREICLRIPLLMTEDLLQDLVLYKKSHEKAISTAARSLVTLFREVCPSLLVKKDRGRPINPKARPRAFGEVNIASNVADLDLLENDDGVAVNDADDDHDGESTFSMSGDEGEVPISDGDEEENDDELDEEGNGNSDGDEEDGDSDGDLNVEEESAGDDDEEEDEDDDDDDDDDDEEEEKEERMAKPLKRKFSDLDGQLDSADTSLPALKRLAGPKTEPVLSDSTDGQEEEQEERIAKPLKRKLSDFDGQLSSADTSLRALKRLAGPKPEPVLSDSTDGILSNEDFKRIRENKAKKQAKIALLQQGLWKGGDAKPAAFKVPSAEQLSVKRVDPSQLEVNIRRRMTKEEKLEMVKAGRDDRGKYQSRTAIKQKKTGGLSNKQKEHKKQMPTVAKRAKIARSRQEKKKFKNKPGKQFQGKKAWKN